MSHAQHQVQTAIEESIRENRVSQLSAVADTSEWVGLAAALSAECDDYSEESSEIGQSRIYWGTDDDGDDWTVRLVAL